MMKPPGIEEDLLVTTDCDTLRRVHMGRLSMREAERMGLWVLEGPPDLVRAFPSWGGLSHFADVAPAAPRSKVEIVEGRAVSSGVDRNFWDGKQWTTVPE